MHENDYQNIFMPELWQHLTFDQRVAALQVLENDHASQSGREPYQIKPMEMPDISHGGQMVAAEKLIVINAAHIQNPTYEYVALYTVLHEGRHAYQRAAIEKEGFHPDHEQVRSWKENAVFYIPSSEQMYIPYRIQPLERDANAYAKVEVDKIVSRLEQAYGKNDIFQQYASHMESETRMVDIAAREKFGDDYIAFMDHTIHKGYQVTRGIDEKKSYKISVRFEETEWSSKCVEVAASGKHQLRESLTREARGFVFSEATRLGIAPAGIQQAQSRVEPIPIAQDLERGKAFEKGRE
ncbi:MAG: hypothetical protein VR64_14660 [Desulfatitalea sp. BRH_c12]|jgi:hypothetical protein|nr:MAG: hypothetical protein VR64_14660 [Desulfatitalea sp. BRH_c12]